MSYYRGENCTCAAWHELECACGADWTDPVVYVLQDRVKELEEIIRGRDELIDNAVSNRIAELEKEVKGLKLQGVKKPYDPIWDGRGR